MKKKFKFLSTILVLPALMGVTLVGCSGAFEDSETETQTAYETSHVSETESSSESEAKVSEAAKSGGSSYNGDIPDGFSARDFDSSYADAKPVTLSDGASATDAEGVSVDGDTITFTTEGTYILTGTLSNGQIVVDLPGENDKIQLVLDGVNVSNTSSACIYVKNADKVFVTTAADSQNSIATTGDFVQIDDNNIDGAVFSKDDIVFNGEGTLSVSSTEHAIVSKNDLKITSGTYEISSDSKALQGKDFVGIAGGKINIDAETDGIYSVRTALYGGDIKINAGDDGINVSENEDGTTPEVILSGGSLDIISGDDAIQTTGDVTVAGTQVNIVSGGGSANAAQHYDDMAFGQMGGWHGMGQGGPKFGGEQSSSGEINYDTDDDENINDGSKNKGIKAANVNLVSGNINIDSQDDAVNADGEVTVTGGSYTFAAGDDGIHADAKIAVNGGELTIEAWEGLESSVIEINDGDITIDAQDDGVNVAQKISGVSPALEINGGNVTINMAQGDTDALDSNGSLYINGGTVSLNCQSPFDYDGDGAISGGTVYVNGEQITEIYNQMMGGAPGAMQGGGMPGGGMQGGGMPGGPRGQF